MKQMDWIVESVWVTQVEPMLTTAVSAINRYQIYVCVWSVWPISSKSYSLTHAGFAAGLFVVDSGSTGFTCRARR